MQGGFLSHFRKYTQRVRNGGFQMGRQMEILPDKTFIASFQISSIFFLSWKCKS